MLRYNINGHDMEITEHPEGDFIDADDIVCPQSKCKHWSGVTSCRKDNCLREANDLYEPREDNK